MTVSTIPIRIACAFVLLAGTAGHVTAAPYQMPKSDVLALPQTSSNGRDYIVYVSFPLTYETSRPDRRYPVIYLCDGYWDFPPVAYAADYIRRDGHAPEAIVVGIGYGGTNPDVGRLRQWDLTPGNDPVYDAPGTVTGHAEEFLTVIATEIIPFVESTYKVDPSFRVLAGNSFGGLFVLYAAFQRPGLFQGIVASSPALDWRNEYVLERARQFAESGAAMNTRIYVGWASGDEEGINTTCLRFSQTVAALGIPRLRLAARMIEGGGHSGTKPENFTRGMRFVFAPQAWVPTVGLDPGYGQIGKLINVSTRGWVGAGERVLIGGVVVSGILPKRLLVRAAGPSLGPLGVTTPLANPRLRVVDASGITVATNDDWSEGSDAAAITAASSEAGAFAFGTGSTDAALIAQLPPGTYTLVVDSVSGSEGIALVEAYELRP